jgi:hypothetical protein
LQEKWPTEKFKSFLEEDSHDGMKYLIRSIHHATRLEKESDNVVQQTTKETTKSVLEVAKSVLEPPRHVPDGIPKTQEEIEEENKALMPESDFTRLLKSLRVYPSWYRERPDVEYS